MLDERALHSVGMCGEQFGGGGERLLGVAGSLHGFGSLPGAARRCPALRALVIRGTWRTSRRADRAR